jgi:hypothetical protein
MLTACGDHRPGDRKMIINALNSGASVFMADFETRTRRAGTTTCRGTNLRRDPRRIDYVSLHKAYKSTKDRGVVRAPARLAPAG